MPLPMPRPVSLAEFFAASDRERIRKEPGDDSPCCTDRSCVLCRVVAEEDHADAERRDPPARTEGRMAGNDGTLYFDEMSIGRALSNAVATGAAQELGEAIARAFTEALQEHVDVRLSRDRLAAMAMPALIEGSDPVGDDKDLEMLARIVAKQSYAFADAMLAERAAPLGPTPASTAIRAAVEVMRDAAERIFNGTADQGTSEELTEAASSLEKGA